MTNPLVSIIVPVYNVQDYLTEALNSLVNQTYREMEIILVNDGSTDRSGYICEQYQRQYPSLIRLITQENKGLSEARNTGLDYASGEYIIFFDSDDYCSENMVELLVDAFSATESDIVISNFENSNSGRVTVYPKAGQVLECILNQSAPFTHSACGKLYSASLFREGRNRFKPGIYYEDLEFFPRVIEECGVTAHLDLQLYHYRQDRTDSIINSKKTVRTDVLEITRELVGRYEGSPELYRAAVNRCFAANFNIFLLSDDDSLRQKCWKVVRQYRLNVIKNRKARTRNRIGGILSFLGADVCSAIMTPIRRKI